MLKNETSSNNYVQINTSEFEDFISENQSAEPKGSDDINTNPNNKGNAMMGNMKTTKEILKGQDDYVSGLAETKIKHAIMIPVKNSIIGEALTNTMFIFFEVSFKVFIYSCALFFSKSSF